MDLANFFKLSEFKPYFLIGGLSTVLDWSIFWVANYPLGMHYEVALILAFVGGGLFHFFSNKIITFKCEYKKIGTQYSLYFVVAIVSLLINMGIIAIFIKVFLLNGMLSRILTTLFMLIPNYLLHKHITFNKKIFMQPDKQGIPREYHKKTT